MSSGQEGIITKDLINSPTRGLNNPSSSNNSNLKRVDVEVPVKREVVQVEKQEEKPLSERFKETVNEVVDKAHEYAEAAEEKAYHLKDKAKEFMNESSVKAKDYTLDAQIKGAVLADRAHRAVNDKVEQVKDYAEQLKSSNTESASEKELRESQQKAVSAGKRMENALNTLIDATGEAMKNLGVKESEHGEFKTTDKSVEFGRGVRDQTAHSASRIHDPSIVTPTTTLTSTEPFAPTENTTAVSESSFVPQEDKKATVEVPPASDSSSTATSDTTSSSSSGGIGGFFSSLFRASSPAPDVSADSFEQPLTSERTFVSEHQIKEATPVLTNDEPLTAERAYGAEQEAKEAVRDNDVDKKEEVVAKEEEVKKEEPGLISSLSSWVSGGGSTRTEEEAKSVSQSDYAKTNLP